MRLPLLSRLRGRQRSRGQSLVELALVLPVILLLFLGIADLSRLYTTMLSVESAAREAADFGAFRSDNWEGSPGDPTSNYAKTVDGMQERACVAASNLPDFVGSGTTCTNPDFDYDLISAGITDCSDSTNATPCRVRVTLTYDFRLIIPFIFEPVLTFARDSTFAISDFEIDQP